LVELRGQAADEVCVADDGDAVPYHGLAGNGEFAVAALFTRHVDYDAAGFHARHIGSSQQTRCRTARYQRRRDDDVDVGGLL